MEYLMLFLIYIIFSILFHLYAYSQDVKSGLKEKDDRPFKEKFFWGTISVLFMPILILLNAI